MPRDSEHFTLEDAEGNAHSYALTPFPWKIGQPICLKVWGLLGGPLGNLLGGMLRGSITDIIGGVNSISQILDSPEVMQRLIGSLAEVDWSEIGADLERQLWTRDVTTLLEELLSATVRDGMDLSQPGACDLAFSANYIEGLKAAGEAIKRNGFFPRLSGGESKKTLTVDLDSRSDSPGSGPQG